MWDNRAATSWDTGYPVGNGRLGVIPLGGYPEEKLLINEETIWHRSPPEKLKLPEDSFKHLEEIRRLDAEGKFNEADGYFKKNIIKGLTADSYQFFGWAKINYDAAPIASTYRELDMETGVALSIHTLADGTVIRQEVFASTPDNVIAIQINSTREISFKISMDGGKVVNDELTAVGNARGTDATKFVGTLRVRANKPATGSDNSLTVAATMRASIYMAIATDYNFANAQQKRPDGWQADAKTTLDALSNKPCDAIRKDAVADHAKYFSRLSLNLGTTNDEIRALPTRDRKWLKSAGKGTTPDADPELLATYVQYGRYLLIASSRPGCLPANLQGLWNPLVKPPWNGDYHININLQMNYWPAEPANLSEMHSSVIKLIDLYQPTGRDMARRLGMKGWCMPHASDVWGNATIFSPSPHYGGSFLCGQWLTQHIYEHFRFTRDKDVLRKNWDNLTAATEFVASWLIPGPNNGELMARPATSPENFFAYTDETGEKKNSAISSGTSYDQFIVMQSFSDYLEAAEALGKTKDPFVQQVAQLLPKVYRPRIAEDGRLMEWRLPFIETDRGHRHISHVIGAYPGNQINLDTDPAMRDAVIKSVNFRIKNGGAGPGWSRAWISGIYARLSNADAAHAHFVHLVRTSARPNLWSSHPPKQTFQIDGNFGGTAAVLEMLLHSHNHEIKLLPALPAARWPEGHVKGIRARGDYTLDIIWREGKLDHAIITAGKNAADQPLKVVYAGKTTTIPLKPGASTTFRAEM